MRFLIDLTFASLSKRRSDASTSPAQVNSKTIKNNLVWFALTIPVAYGIMNLRMEET
jgi:hypothetical protein